MPHPVLFKLGKQLMQFLIADLFNNFPAIGRHHIEFVFIMGEDPGNEGAIVFLQIAQDPKFIEKAFPGFGTVESLVHASVVTDMNGGLFGIFNFMHTRTLASFRGEGKGGFFEKNQKKFLEWPAVCYSQK